MQLSKFVDSQTMIQNLDTTDVETSLSDILTKIKEEELWTKYDYKKLQILSDDRKAANFVLLLIGLLSVENFSPCRRA